MCSILNNRVSKKCTCQLAHLCKRRRKPEAEENLQPDLRKLLIMTAASSSLTFNHALIANQIHAKEGNHI
jgi:hypothetical protein